MAKADTRPENVARSAEMSANLTKEETIVALRRKCALFESSLKQAGQRIGDLQANIDSLPSASDLNPLIDEHGDFVRVKASLKFLATVFFQADPDDGIPLSFDQCCGLSYILQACTAAMDEMDANSYRKGGAA